MLHNRMNLLSKIIAVVLCCVFISSDVFASASTRNNGSFDVQKNSTLTWGVGDYLLDGCSHPSSFDNSCRGTYDDEGAIVVNMARKFNDKGGYFCPTQIQFANTNGKTRIWIDLYKPVDPADCKWICIDGYKGNDCAEEDDGTIVDNESMKLLKKGTSRKSGGSSNKVSDTVDIFAKSEHTSNSSNRGAWIHVLAILKYMDHGVLVGHLWVYGTRDYGCLWGSCIKSWVTKTHGETNNGREVLMCADGYRVVNNQCGLISENPVPKPMCAGWTEQEYKANETDFEYYNDGDCRKFRCSDRNKAFPNETTHKCEPCSTGVRGGASKTTGVCKRCDLGQYFDSNTDTCKTATGLSKSDLQYGKNKSNEGNPKDQCWTKTDPDAYRCCVLKTSEACNAASSKGTNTTSGYVNDFSSFRDV